MTLESVNPENLPTPQTYTHVVAATGRRLHSSLAKSPRTVRAIWSGSVTWQPRHVRCSPTSAALLRRPARGLIR